MLCSEKDCFVLEEKLSCVLPLWATALTSGRCEIKSMFVGAKSARNGKSPGWPLGEEWGETCRANICNMADGFERKKCSNVFRGTFVHSTSQNAMEIMQDKIVGISLSGKVCVIFSLHG